MAAPMKTIAQHLEMMQRLLREMTQYFVTGFPIFCRCTYVCWYFTIVVQCYNLYIRRDPNVPHNSSGI